MPTLQDRERDRLADVSSLWPDESDRCSASTIAALGATTYIKEAKNALGWAHLCGIAGDNC